MALTPGLRIALVGFGLTCATASAMACEDGHWVDRVSRGGRIVILEDGSVWSIQAGDEILTSLWLPTTEIVACSDKLINTDDDEIAEARRIR